MKNDNDNAPVVASRNNGAQDKSEPLRFLSVCSGIEAASVAWPHWQAVAFSEIEKFPSAVLAHHYPDVPNLGDFTKIDTATLGRVDILCGGTPCQAFSVAGLRQSLADERGNLSLEFVRLAHELANGNGLRNVVWENVVGVLSTKDNAFGCFLGGLVGADAAIVPPDGRNGKPGKWTRHGMVAGPKGRVAWAVKNAEFFGVAQRRRRVLVVADFGNGADPAQVLFEPESVYRNPPPRRETGEGVAAFSASSIGGYCDAEVSGADRAVGGDNGGGSENLVYAPEIARCVATREGSSQDYESTTMVAVGVTGDVAHTLKAEGADASEDGTGRGTPVVAFDVRPINTQVGLRHEALGERTGLGIGKVGDPAFTLSKSHSHAIAQTVAIRGRDGGATAELGGEVATALRASSGGGDKPHVLAAVGFNAEAQADQLPSTDRDTSVNDGLTVSQRAAVATTSSVRRLTPRECERLQGFPDDYTLIPVRKVSKANQEKARAEDSGAFREMDGVMWAMAADGPRYKALGNSWAVPKFRWLGERIERFMPSLAQTKKAA